MKTERQPRRPWCGRPRATATLLLALAVACGPRPAKAPDDAPPPAEPAAETTPPSSDPDSATQADVDDVDAALDRDVAEFEREAGLTPGESVEDTSLRDGPGGQTAAGGRDIVYRMSSGELSVEIEGITFKPKAKAVNRGQGTIVELEVTASAKSGSHWIKSPSERPLSIAGEIIARDGATERFQDRRRGEGELFVAEGETRRFRQTWPGPGQPRLARGRRASLEIGLWGLRSTADEHERPVQRLFVVKVAATERPTATILPPDVMPQE